MFILIKWEFGKSEPMPQTWCFGTQQEVEMFAQWFKVRTQPNVFYWAEKYEVSL